MEDRQTKLPCRGIRALLLGAIALACLVSGGCKSPWSYFIEADEVALDIVKDSQTQAVGRPEPFSIETPADALRRRLLKAQGLQVAGPSSLGSDKLKPVAHWPSSKAKPAPKGAAGGPVPNVGAEVKITLMQALQIAARNNREYQSAKEDVFIAALDLDLESQEFRNTYVGLLSGEMSHDQSGARPVGGGVASGSASWSRRFRSGAALTGRLGVDIAKLLTRGYGSSLGVFADASISVPLLRGAGRHIVTEPLTQAQRDVIYSLHTLERHKRTLAVQVATDYLGVLQQADQVKNAADNHRRLIKAGERSARLGDAGRLPKTQVNQAQQDELRARDRVITARNSYERSLDTLKLTLGLPTDARIVLDRNELSKLVDQARAALAANAEDKTKTRRGKMELPVKKALKLALGNRLDMRTAQGRVLDAQRGVVVAADGLKADLTLDAGMAMGASRGVATAGSHNAHLRPEKGVYSGTVTSDLPWERTAERNAYRASHIALEQAVRDVQSLEDRIKLSIRGALRTLARTRQSFVIQSSAVELATTRVKSTELFLEAGRAAIRDVLESQEALVQAQDALTAALVDYRIAELELQRDMGLLEVDEKGLWREYRPE
ncbi:MAG: TolC family protein [Phycisphaerae bacterium]|jgi:outer membrane protein TolC|nr:TolC family protein [Phycisphaerae bacterium]